MLFRSMAVRDQPADLRLAFDRLGRVVDWKKTGNYLEDVQELYEAIQRAKAVTDKPSLIVLRTIIGWPSPKKQNTGKIHGSALGAEELAGLKTALGFDPEQTFEVAPEVIAHTRGYQQLADQVRAVSAIGITGQQHGMLLVGTDHKPISPLINWQDRRALELVPSADVSWLQQTRKLLGEDVWKRTGCRLQPGFMAGTLFWLKAHQLLPDHSRALFVMDHFGAILTGSPAVTEPSCAGSSGVFNVLTRNWDDEAIGALGLPRSVFPEVREVSEPIGRLTSEIAAQTGLAAGIPICAAIGDHQASFLGSVTDRDTSVLVNVGTGAQVAVFT